MTIDHRSNLNRENIEEYRERVQQLLTRYQEPPLLKEDVETPI